jgi:hypothetical protein
MTTIDKARGRIQAFANRQKAVFEDHGEVGFGRPCVGLTKGSGYIELNPYRYVFKPFDPNPEMETIDELSDRRLYAPDSVPDVYHKHDCIAVLVQDDDYNRAILQLADWVAHLESIGAEVVPYETGRQGVHLLVGGAIGYAVRATDGLVWKQGQREPTSIANGG